jgi:hypothetical protein
MKAYLCDLCGRAFGQGEVHDDSARGRVFSLRAQKSGRWHSTVREGYAPYAQLHLCVGCIAGIAYIGAQRVGSQTFARYQAGTAERFRRDREESEKLRVMIDEATQQENNTQTGQ